MSSMVLFLRRAACGVGPAVDADRFGTVEVVEAGLSIVAAGVDDAGLLRLPNRPPLAGAAVDVGAASAAVLEVVADVVPKLPNSPPLAGAAAVVEGVALDVDAVVLEAPPNKPPAAGVAAGLPGLPNKPPEGAGVVLDEAGGADEVAPNSPEVGAVLTAGAVAVVELGAADEDEAAPNSPPDDAEGVAVVEVVLPNRPLGVGFVFAAPAKSPPDDGAAPVVDEPPPNNPPDGAAVVVGVAD